jgi:hypothetical protein
MEDVEIDRLAKAHKLSICAAIVGFVGMCTSIYIVLAAIPFHIYCAFRVGRGMGLGTAALITTLVLMLAPFVNTLSLLLLNNRASRMLKASGMKMGPMGFKRAHEAHTYSSADIFPSGKVADIESKSPCEVLAPKELP